MIEPDPASAAPSKLFNLRSALGNPRLNFPKFKKSLIQVSFNTAQYHDTTGLSGYFLPDGPWLAVQGGIATPRPTNERPILAGATAAAQAIYKAEFKEFTKVLNDISVLRQDIILSLPEYVVKTLEDPEIGIALVTGRQIVDAAYLELGTVHMSDLEEARLALESPIEDAFDVHLSNFMEGCTFLAANSATVSPVDMIRMLTTSIKNLGTLHSWATRFPEFYPLPIQRTMANFVSHLRTGVRNLTSEDAGYAHALQRSDVTPAGRGPGRGRGRGGRGGRGGASTPYVKVFVDPSFVPPAGTKYCWFHGYKGHNGTECRNSELTAAQKNAKTHSDVAGGCLQSTI